jgi:hypothetical protein
MTGDGFKLLDDVLGNGFALLASPGPPQALAEAWRARGGTIQMRGVAVLDREDASPVEPPMITTRDLRDDLAKLLHDHPPGLFLCGPTATSRRSFRPQASRPQSPLGLPPSSVLRRRLHNQVAVVVD